MQTHTTEYEYVMQASHIAYAYYNGTCKRFSLLRTLAFQIHSERKGWFPSSFEVMDGNGTAFDPAAQGRY